MDQSDQAGGGYCVVYDSSGDGSGKTYYLDDDDFEEAFAGGTISEDYYLEDDSDNDYGFEIFDCSVDTDTPSITCDKFQKIPASTYTDSFRFESGNFAKAIVFDADNAEFTDTFITLANAVALVAGGLFSASM